MTAKGWNGCAALSLANVLLTAAVTLVGVSLFYQSGSAWPWGLLAYAVGLFLSGPFNAYLLDTYKRKNIGIEAILLQLLVALALLSRSLACPYDWGLRLLQGLSFALMQVSLGSTLLNDLSVSSKRDASDYYYTLSGRVGFLGGLALGAFLSSLPTYYHFGLIVPSVFLLVAGLLILPLKVPFRAPLVLPLFSVDRFWFRGGEFLWMSCFLTSVAVGGLLFLLHAPFGVWTYLSAVAVLLLFYFFHFTRFRRLVACGFLLLMTFSLLRNLLLAFPVAGLLVGLGMGCAVAFLSVGFLLAFLQDTNHCQRGTAQHSYLLSGESGLAVGAALAYLLSDAYGAIGLPLAVGGAILFFLLALSRK